jgi:hypothetical protein
MLLVLLARDVALRWLAHQAQDRAAARAHEQLLATDKGRLDELAKQVAELATKVRRVAGGAADTEFGAATRR